MGKKLFTCTRNKSTSAKLYKMYDVGNKRFEFCQCCFLLNKKILFLMHNNNFSASFKKESVSKTSSK